MDQRPLNLIVVICHDLGQHLGCYGAPGVRTPNLDAFAAQGVRFENSFCTAPQCSPSRAALWTGRYPHANGVVGLAHDGFRNDLHTSERHLAQMLRIHGYETHLFGHQHVSPTPQRCGFEHIHGSGPCAEIAREASTFLRGRRGKEKPLFAQIAFFEPHRPFDHGDVDAQEPSRMTVPPYLPDIPEVRRDLADLEASASSADKAFGVVVKAIDSAGLADDTIVLFTVDHGIAFPHAKMTLYDPGIDVALLIRLPGMEGGRVHSEMISNVDVMPTLLELLGLRVPRNIQGRSFGSLLAGEMYKPREAIFAEKTYHTYYDPMRAIRTARWKLIANFENAPFQETSPDYDNNAKSYVEIAKARPTPSHIHPPLELYDLAADPWEQHNLADQPEHATLRDRLIRSLRRWMEETGDPLLDGPMAQAAYTERMAAFKSV